MPGEPLLQSKSGKKAVFSEEYGPPRMSSALMRGGMPTRDFFVFCTTLPPVELRSLGSFSKVLHLPAGKVIYEPGDAAEAFYIINRGIVDLLPAKGKGGPTPATFLSRGDIFGDLEILAEGPRRELARARQPVSLQCFERKDLDVLQERVPSFSRFLCQHLAYRLKIACEAVVSKTQDLHLSGNLANFDLVTIYQTIAQSCQTGRLSVVDEHGDLVAEFHFASGKPLAGHFLHLTGEEAFWQIFLAHHLQGTFTFVSGLEKWDEPKEKTIERSANDVLFNAIHYRDEFQLIKRELPPSSVLEIGQAFLQHSPTDGSVPRFIMDEVWRRASQRRTAISDLFPYCSVCELKIYLAVRELVRGGHLLLAMTEEPQKVA